MQLTEFFLCVRHGLGQVERESHKHSQNACIMLRSFAIKSVKEFCRKMAVKDIF